MDRILGLVDEITGYEFEGLLASSGWFRLTCREKICVNVSGIISKKRKGAGLNIHLNRSDGKDSISAEDGYGYYLETGKSPLSKWEAYRFKFKG
jgi:hypothetical protein